MSKRDKYAGVIGYAQDLNAKDLEVNEENNVLKLHGTVNTQYEKNLIWDKIKEVGGENYDDVQADIRVSNEDYFHLHEVKSGENLSKISEKYYRDPNKYMDIFNANKDQLSNPDLIKPGQQLKIPNPNK